MRMSKVVFKSDDRGLADHGWLIARHSFSFAGYYDPQKVHFGALRVLNDDIIAPGKGFGTHPHDNMEIITIPFAGALEHRDSMGNHGVIRAGEIQVMSAGTGIQHSEFNPSSKEEVRLFQIWLIPKIKSVTPRYDQFKINDISCKNELYQIISPDSNDQGSWIYQDAWFFMGEFDQNKQTTYSIKKDGNGVYIILIAGKATIEGEILTTRDAISVTDMASISIEVEKDTSILLMDIPLTW